MRRAAAALAVLCLASCGWMNDDKGWIVNRSDDYLTAKEGPPLEVPAGLADAGIVDAMPIAPLTTTVRHGDLLLKVPPPETIYAREEGQEVKIQKLGDTRWLLISQSPSIVWPKVKQFFADNGVPIAKENPEAGRMDTAWLTIDKATARDVVRLTILQGKEAAAITTGDDRVEILVEQGIRDRSSEIHLRYQNNSKSVPLLDTLPDESDEPGIETKLLNELGAYVAANVADGTVSYVARNISTQNKATIENDAQNLPVLHLNLDFDRAWATINQSLDEAKIPITDMDRSGGIFYITVSDQLLNQEKQPGIFTRWMHSEHKQAVEVRMLPGTPGYAVTLFDSAGQRLPAELSEQILIMIREFAA
jgi:outer membrane protein assembly factor BamC